MTPSEVGSPTSRFESGYPSPRTTRSPSISSDIPSVANLVGLLSPPTSVSPEAAFIAVSAASQIVTNDHDSQSEAWLDQHGIEPSGETALVSPPALKLVNRFLDQLLFNFLSVSRSTSLTALRPAVSEVLKPKLAKGAISGADSELHEYLGSEEDEELLALHNGPSQSRDWDLELVWKRTRLRCMVYSSLGDMEEEEEDFYTEQEQLEPSPGAPPNEGVVSPAVAIFLTSILEFMGEQVLVVAGQAAYHRLRLKHERDERDGRNTPADIAERVVVEESDMERVALDRTLGRLWRGWKKRIRSPIGSVSILPRPFSRESTRSQPHTSQAGTAPEEQIEEEPILTEHERAARIPLPATEDDVREIEIPGLARQPDNEDEDDIEEDDEAALPARPVSFQFWAYQIQDIHEPTPSHIYVPKFIASASRKRSNSLPSTVSKRPKPSTDEPSEDQEDVEADEPTEAVEESGDPLSNMSEEPAHPKLPERSPARRGVAVSGTGAALIAAAVAAKDEYREAESGLEEADSEEELHEEPQIMTSSRISIGGRISPDDMPIPSKRSSVRSHSVHSLRLIEVSSPKSPARSRGASIDAHDYPLTGHPTIVSPTSATSPLTITPHVASPMSQVRTASPISRNGSSNSSRHLGNNSATESISEGEEQDMAENDLGPEPVMPSHFAAAMQGIETWPAPSTAQFTPAPVNRETKPQPSSFVLSPAPTTRNVRGVTSAPMSGASNQPNPALMVASKTRADHGGIPPLTPLREMMEGAPDTSDEASSVAPSYDGQYHSEKGMGGHSASVSASSLAQRSVRPHATSISRSSPPRSSREENPRKDSRAQRPIHTSGSSSSTVSHKFRPMRSSEDSAHGVVEDKGKSFEQLIRSDQTIQYTLTPANMRDIEAPDSPHSPRLITSPMRANFPTFPEGPRPSSGRSHSSSVGKYGKPAAGDPPQPFKNVKATNGGSKLVLNTAVGQRPNAPQPRGARVEAESIEDFAEFIKATGPATRYDSAPRSAPPIEAPRFNGPPRKSSATEASIGVNTSFPRRMDSAAGRMKPQARDAVVTRSDGISDLIDFMRSGPQDDMQNHRMPRRDADHVSEGFGSSLSDPRYSQTPTSVHSSVTSQSALLNGSSKMNNKPLPPQNNRGHDEEDMMPKRKTRRVRDMYQIDFSDEEEEYKAAGRPNPIQEESLADFLRNVAPPAESTTTPVFEPAPVSSKKIKRKSSTTGIMSRFSRNSQQINPKLKSIGQEARPGSRTDSITASHTPISVQYSSGYRTSTNDEPRAGSYAPKIDPPRTKVAQKSYQPREAVYSTTRTNELAAFLRDSDPPSAMQAQPQTFPPTVQKEEASTFQRVFGRRKVH